MILRWDRIFSHILEHRIRVLAFGSALEVAGVAACMIKCTVVRVGNPEWIAGCRIDGIESIYKILLL